MASFAAALPAGYVPLPPALNLPERTWLCVAWETSNAYILGEAQFKLSFIIGMTCATRNSKLLVAYGITPDYVNPSGIVMCAYSPKFVNYAASAKLALHALDA